MTNLRNLTSALPHTHLSTAARQAHRAPSMDPNITRSTRVKYARYARFARLALQRVVSGYSWLPHSINENLHGLIKFLCSSDLLSWLIYSRALQVFCNSRRVCWQSQAVEHRFLSAEVPTGPLLICTLMSTSLDFTCTHRSRYDSGSSRRKA